MKIRGRILCAVRTAAGAGLICISGDFAFAEDTDERPGERLAITASISQTTAGIMARPQAVPPPRVFPKQRASAIDHRVIPSGGGFCSRWPIPDVPAISSGAGAPPFAPQIPGIQFDGVTGPTETGGFPPDTNGAVGPTQFFVATNGRLRTFNKTTGVADGVLNSSTNVFFNSVTTPPTAGEVVFTATPNVRYDRLSGRWFVAMVDRVINGTTGANTRANRVLLAMTDAASAGVISAATVWTFYQFQGDANLVTLDTSLGVDASALYLGARIFTIAGAYSSSRGFVIPKAPLLAGSMPTVWNFPGLVATSTSAGPRFPRAVDNYDPDNVGAGALGYFIGTDNVTFNTLQIRRVTNPGSVGPPPTISGNLTLVTPLTTRAPVLVPHLGNTGGSGGRLDAADDRLYAAHLRDGRLWTAHHIGVNNTGVAGATNNRNAVRWYELQNLDGTPSLVQSGTLWDNNATNDSNQRNYWFPTIMVTGQGHAALACSTAGTNERINAFTTGRLLGDTLGTMRDGPGGSALPGYTASSFPYNPPADPGGPSRRWGEYSYTSLDPLDDMTMWTIQEYCNGSNTYGCRAVKLIAPPPPASATVSPSGVPLNQSSNIVNVTGTPTNGSGYFNTGTEGFAVAPNHITATGSGITVNSITYVGPTHVILHLSTVGATTGNKTITIRNPDGQSSTVNVLVSPNAPMQMTTAVSQKTHGAAGSFSINLPLSGEPGVECRSTGGNHSIVFTFNNSIMSGSATVSSGSALAGSPVISGNTMTVPLTNVTDQQKIIVTAFGVTDFTGLVAPDTPVSLNVLAGDTNGNKTVNATDIGQTKAQSGAVITTANFRQDVNAGGSINATDIALVKANAGHALP
jgi:hypothetical protein